MRRNIIYLAGVFMLVACSELERIEPSKVEVNIVSDTISFAEIGDFGFAGMPEFYVADMVKKWNPDFIVSAGDNNYYQGKISTIKNNISQFYGDYIYNFDAPYEFQCNGKAFQDKTNRFFATPGNHDANNKDKLTPYYNFFTLPGNESYYRFTWGPVTFYTVNSADEDLEEQKAWLARETRICNTPFKVLFFHHPPFSSGSHGNNEYMQWDFYSMGIDAILVGHDHIYERIEKKGQEGMYYIVNGLGGKEVSPCNEHPFPAGEFNTFCYSGNYGAIKGKANLHKLVFEFYSIEEPEKAVDRIEIMK
ncbi:MAG TPA: metallophosphoesterase [Bacteroidales bacterium]|nr:metallophosphoesterase [Bacteroidales bacterium]